MKKQRNPLREVSQMAQTTGHTIEGQRLTTARGGGDWKTGNISGTDDWHVLK